MDEENVLSFILSYLKLYKASYLPKLPLHDISNYNAKCQNGHMLGLLESELAFVENLQINPNVLQSPRVLLLIKCP